MKRLLVIALVLLVGCGNAVWANALESTSPLAQESELSLTIHLGDISGKSEAEIEAEIAQHFESMIPLDQADLQCKVTVTAELNIGVASFTISVEVSGDCTTIARHGKSIAAMVINEVESEIKNLF